MSVCATLSVTGAADIVGKIEVGQWRLLNLGDFGLDPNIEAGSSPDALGGAGYLRFRPIGAGGNRVWLPGSLVGDHVIVLTVLRPSTATGSASVEGNCSYGFRATVDPGGAFNNKIPPSWIVGCPGRTLSEIEMPGLPIARVDGSEINIWLGGDIVDILAMVMTPEALAGDTVHVEATVKNRGNISGSLNYKVVETDPAGVTRDVMACASVSLLPGEVNRRESSFTLPTTAGAYTYCFAGC